MNDTLDTDSDGLVDEIVRYLGAVDVFRAEGCEPTWQPATPSDQGAPLPAAASKTRPSDVRLH